MQHLLLYTYRKSRTSAPIPLLSPSPSPSLATLTVSRFSNTRKRNSTRRLSSNCLVRSRFCLSTSQHQFLQWSLNRLNSVPSTPIRAFSTPYSRCALSRLRYAASRWLVATARASSRMFSTFAVCSTAGALMRDWGRAVLACACSCRALQYTSHSAHKEIK
jgi:hypothetical protein